MTSVKRYPIWGVCGVLLWVPVCMRCRTRTRGTHNRTGVSFNRGYDTCVEAVRQALRRTRDTRWRRIVRCRRTQCSSRSPRTARYSPRAQSPAGRRSRARIAVRRGSGCAHYCRGSTPCRRDLHKKDEEGDMERSELYSEHFDNRYNRNAADADHRVRRTWDRRVPLATRAARLYHLLIQRSP